MATKAGGHGDFRMIVLAPASVQEMADLTVKGFDLADEYRMTSMILCRRHDGPDDGTRQPRNSANRKKFDKPWATTERR